MSMTTNSNTADDAIFDNDSDVTDVDTGAVGVAAVRTPTAPVPDCACARCGRRSVRRAGARAGGGVALALARRQGATFFELRAAVDDFDLHRARRAEQRKGVATSPPAKRTTPSRSSWPVAAHVRRSRFSAAESDRPSPGRRRRWAAAVPAAARQRDRTQAWVGSVPATARAACETRPAAIMNGIPSSGSGARMAAASSPEVSPGLSTLRTSRSS